MEIFSFATHILYMDLSKHTRSKQRKSKALYSTSGYPCIASCHCRLPDEATVVSVYSSHFQNSVSTTQTYCGTYFEIEISGNRLSTIKNSDTSKMTSILSTLMLRFKRYSHDSTLLNDMESYDSVL
jgi:hypothetical protein